MKELIKSFLLYLSSLFLLLTCFWLGLDFWKNGGEQKYAEIFPTEIKIKNNLNKKISLKEPIVLVFSVPVKGEVYIRETHLEPYNKAKIKYEGISRTLTISPLEDWQLEKKYILTLPKSRNNRWAEVSSQKVEFFTLNFPQVEKIYPLDNAEEILLEIENPIKINLKEPAQDFDLDFQISPKEDLVVEKDDNQQFFKILPKKPLLPDTQYQLIINASLKEDKEKKKRIFESTFKTLAEKPIKWEKDLNLRVAQAKKYTRAKIYLGKYIDINLENQIMVLFQEGIAVEAFAVSSGKEGMETPKGEYQIYNKAERVWSKKYGLYMPFWMAIISDGSVGIHELPEWPGGFKEGASHLGIPASHGCVRLGVGSAQTVFDWAEIGTPVIVY